MTTLKEKPIISDEFRRLILMLNQKIQNPNPDELMIEVDLAMSWTRMN